MATILITGGTGLIGTALTKALVAKGNDVIILTRNKKEKQNEKNIFYAQWNIEEQTINEDAIKKADAIVHLAGANVGERRWTKKRKKEIIDSRVKSAELLVSSLKKIPNKVNAVISASAIGYYGSDMQLPNPKPFVETDVPSNDFLGTVVQQWEGSILSVTKLKKRLVIFRTGIVLSNEGGAYKEFKKPLKFGMASTLGNGKQLVSWIHIDDLVRLYMEAIGNENWQGVYNAVAPNPVSNKQLIKEIARHQKFSIPVKVPEFVLKAVLGQMSIEVLKSTTVSPAKIERQGFQFLFPGIEEAVKNLTFHRNAALR